MNVTDSVVSITSDNAFSRLFIGREEGTTGTLNIQGASTSFTVVGGESGGITIGRDTGSTGSATVTNGALLQVNSDDSFLQLGREAGSTGTLTVSNGGQVVVTDSTDGDVLVGAAFADFGRPEGGTGTLNVTGTGSSVTTDDTVIVGAPEQFGGGTSSGSLSISDGGSVTANEVLIGTGGLLNGNGGTIFGNLVADGGLIAPGFSPGILTVDGDFTFLGGLLEIEIGGTALGEFDVLNVLGDFIAPSAFDIELSFINGFTPEEGDVFNFLNIAGDTSDLDALFVASLVNFDVVGLPNSFGIDLGFDGMQLSAIASSVAPIPLPAALPLFAGGLSLMGLLGWRKKRAAT